MAAEQKVVDQFNTKCDEISQPTMKIQHNNLWFNPSINEYSKELQNVRENIERLYS